MMVWIQNQLFFSNSLTGGNCYDISHKNLFPSSSYICSICLAYITLSASSSQCRMAVLRWFITIGLLFAEEIPSMIILLASSTLTLSGRLWQELYRLRVFRSVALLIYYIRWVSWLLRQRIWNIRSLTVEGFADMFCGEVKNFSRS